MDSIFRITEVIKKVGFAIYRRVGCYRLLERDVIITR